MDADHRIAELETLIAIGEVLNREPSFDVACQQALERLVELVGVTSGWVFLARTEHGDPHHSTFRLAAQVGIPEGLAADELRPLRKGSCECMGMFRRAELDTGVNVVTCSRIEDRLDAPADLGGLRIHASIPVLGRDVPHGIINLASPGDHQFDPETLRLLTSVGQQLGIAYERGRAVEQRRLDAQHVAALEERSRVARDIHDSVTQLLFGAHLALRVAREGDDAERRDHAVERSSGLVESALGELRGLVELLRSADLEQGLYPALVRLRDRLTSERVAVHLDAEPFDVPTAAADGLHRIVQEAVHNALKHAGAGDIWIRLGRGDDRLELVVEDDGAGFPPDLVAGVGLDSIRARVESMDGTLELTDRPDGGARVRVEVPCPPES